ncbi:MAG: MlaD family protein [Pseudomonadota bacterium]
METRANYILIGLFTLATILGAFGFVYWFHHVGGTGERMTYRVMFQGPIGGLRSGASVTFNGIRVGEVTELSLDPKDPKNSIATISVEASTPVRADTEVSLDSQGLTGIAVLALRGGSSSAGPVTATMDDTPLLVAGSSASQDMMAAAGGVAGGGARRPATDRCGPGRKPADAEEFAEKHRDLHRNAGEKFGLAIEVGQEY